MNRQCLFPAPCKNLTVDHSDYIKLLRKLRKVPGVKKVFIRSGIRFDYCMCDADDTFIRELCEHHISGQLRVAPEHISDNVLTKMESLPMMYMKSSYNVISALIIRQASSSSLSHILCQATPVRL